MLFYLVWSKKLDCALDAVCAGSWQLCWAVQAGTLWWHSDTRPYLKHAKAPAENCHAHFRAKCMQGLLQGRKKDDFSVYVACCIDFGKICGAQVLKF